MTVSLYECMAAVGLQHHYARFTSVGVCHAAQLSVLTMEDYPLLGIRTMEDRTRLFHLVQLVKSLDLENLGYDDVIEDDYDYSVDGGDEDFAVDSSFKHDGCGNPDEDVSDGEHENGAGLSKNATTFARSPSVRRRLDFSNESIDHHQEECSCPGGTVHVYASCHRNDELVQSKGSTIPAKLDIDSGSTVVCGCQGNNNHKLDVRSHPSDRDKGENIKPDIIGEIVMYGSDNQKSSKYESFHKPAPSPATNIFPSKPFGHKHKRGISRKQHLYTEVDGTFGHIAKPTPVYEARRTAGYNYGLPLSSPLVPNKIYKKQTGEQSISVCVRKRPLTRSESRRGEADVVTTPGGECVIVHESKEAVDLTQYILQHRFYFDQVFGAESSNEEVYRRTAYPLVQHMLSGGKATCFAYGQTGAGKTYTMLGSSPGTPGLYAMAVRDIFAHLSTTNTYSSLRVHVSFFEIYCGQLYDLLDNRKRLFAREDGQKVVHISGLRDVRVDSVHSLLEVYRFCGYVLTDELADSYTLEILSSKKKYQVISQGTEERTQGTSGVNPLSSRSHALLQIQLRDPNQQIAGRIWFVDLAGSERASDTKEPDRQSRMEGAEINQSLLALKECIRSLDREQSHTPFRQSKLTQVLKDSFVGDSMTCMIANISPGHTATEHTLNTLRYADRVKELRGQGGLKGRRRGKTVPSPKHNQSKSSSSSSSTSSVGTRGKSPPKKPKLGRQSEACRPTTPTRESRVKDVILCSTPKNNRCEEEANTRTRKGIGLENTTPVRGWLAMGDKRHGGAGERESRRIKNESYGGIGNDSVSEQSTLAGLVQGQPIDKQLPSWRVLKEEVAEEGNLSLTERELRFYHSEKESQPKRGGRVEEGEKWTELRRQVERSKVESPRETGLQKTGERDKERERHLKRYHEQLQQFMTSSTSSSAHLFSPSTCPSIASSTKGSLPYSVSPPSLRHPSCLSVSPHTYQELEEVLEAYAAKVEARVDANRGHSPDGEIHLQTETSTVCNHSNDEDDHGGVHGGLRVSWEGTEAGYGQNRHKTERKRLVEATVEASIRKEDKRPSDMEEGKRKWAWVSTTEKEASNRTAGAISTNVEERFSYSCSSENRREVGVEGLNASGVAADGVWSTEQGRAADNYSNDDSNSLFSHPPFESPSQQAPAERPLSPAWEHANTFLTPEELSNAFPESTYSKYNTNILPVPLQNTSEVGPSNCHRQKQPWLGMNASKTQISHAQSATLPLTATIMHTGSKTPADPLSKLSENPACSQIRNQPDLKVNMSADETCSDSLSYIMDPLTVSLLQVDQQAATASFIQGDNNSLCLLQDKNGEDDRRKVDKKCLKCVEKVGKVIESQDMTFCLSHVELPQAKTQHATTPETATDTNQTEQRKDKQICGKGRNKLLIPGVMLENNQKPETTPTLGNKASTLKPSTSAAMPASFMSPSVQHFGNTSSPGLHNPVTNATQIVYAPNGHKSSCVTTPQPENVSGKFNTMQSQCHTVHSKHPSNSNISRQLNSPADLYGQGSTSNQQIRPTIHLFPVDDLEKAKWCIVEAHLEQLKEMETLWHKEGKLLCQQPDMAFGEYVHRLEEIMERKARCVRSMRAQLQPYLKPTHSNHLHPQ